MTMNSLNSNIIQEEQQTRRTIYHKKTTGIRSKSADHLQTASSSKTRSSTIYIDEVQRERRRFTNLNNRFSNYLDSIKILADINLDLRHQIDDIYTEEEKSNHHNSSEIEFNKLRQQLDNELRKLLSTQIHFQRADYDKKYYKNKTKLFSTSDQDQRLQQQLNSNIHELDLLKQQYENQKQELDVYKKRYNEYMNKLIEYTNQYNSISFERIQTENCLYTLQEQISFEREYNRQCLQEFEYLETVQCDLNNQFNKTEFENTIKRIREDYEKYNEIQLSELEIIYETKFNSFEINFQQDKKEDHVEELKNLATENQSLQQQLKQLEYDLHHLNQHNYQQIDILNSEYNQLENQLPNLESLIVNLRENTVYLSSEIDTYRCLLINLVPARKSSVYTEQINGFTVHHENGLMWIRI